MNAMPLPGSARPPAQPFAVGPGTPRDAAPGWCLRFLSGAMKGRSIALKPGPNVLGSAGDCDLMLPGSDVQPRHLVFGVGELAVSVQRVGTAAALLNGEELKTQRRSVVAGDVVAIGQIEVQMDRSYALETRDESASEWAESILPGDAGGLREGPAPAAPRFGYAAWAALPLAIAALLAVALLTGGATAPPGSGGLDLAELEQRLAPFPEVEVVAAPGGQFSLKGFVESRQRKLALQQALLPYGHRVGLNVQAADELVEQARRYVGDPGVAMTYAGRGRLVVSGSVEDEAVRQKIRRLSEDLHPTVLVSDKLQVRPKSNADKDAEQRAQWSGWQGVLPARMVSITEDGHGLRYIQLANGNRYYEGSLLRSGAELTRIEADGLVITGGKPKPQLQ